MVEAAMEEMERLLEALGVAEKIPTELYQMKLPMFLATIMTMIDAYASIHKVPMEDMNEYISNLGALHRAVNEELVEMKLDD